jgi:hypothetical protein
MLCPIKILGTLRSSAAYRVDQLREMFGCTLLVCALCLIYVIDNGQLEYYGGTHRVKSQMLPSSLGWCLGMTPTNRCHGPHRRQTGKWSEVGKYSQRKPLEGNARVGQLTLPKT